jgi:hypothetical protein
LFVNCRKAYWCPAAPEDRNAETVNDEVGQSAGPAGGALAGPVAGMLCGALGLLAVECAATDPLPFAVLVDRAGEPVAVATLTEPVPEPTAEAAGGGGVLAGTAGAALSWVEVEQPTVRTRIAATAPVPPSARRRRGVPITECYLSSKPGRGA